MPTVNAVEILSLIRLIQDLAPEAVAAVRALIDKLTGLTPDQIVALTHQLNAGTEAAIDAELAPKPVI